MQITDRALAADRAVIEMRWRGTDPRRELPFRIPVAPAQEIDDVERADLAEQLGAGVSLRALQGSSRQGARPAAGGEVRGPAADCAGPGDDGEAVLGGGGCFIFFLFPFPNPRRSFCPSLRGA